MSERDQGTQGTSRREFLKGVAGVGAGLTIAGMLGGCASGQQGEQVSTSGAYPYAVHDADVLVVGGGLAGMAAARVAFKAGAKVVMIDKGKTGHSGNTGIAWGMYPVTSEFSADKTGTAATAGVAIDTSGVIDQEYGMSLIQASITNPVVRFCEQSGCVLERSLLDGSLWGMPLDPEERAAAPFVMTTGAFWRHAAQHLERIGMEIHDRMMMIDIVKGSDGAAAGLVAIDLKTGNAHVFRAKKIVMATGGYNWAHGTTIGCPEDTGETHALFLKNGLPMRDCEFNQVDVVAPGPYGQRLDGPDQGWLEITCGPTIAGPYYPSSKNKNGEAYMTGYFSDPEVTKYVAASFVGTVLCSVREVLQGNGITVDGGLTGLLRDVTGEIDGKSPLSVYPFITEWTCNVQEAFGEDYLDLAKLECFFESYGSGGMPNVNSKTFETDIPGLYYAGHANNSFGSLVAWGSGTVSGAAAAEASKDATLIEYDSQAVDDVLKEAYSWLEKPNSDNSIRPIVIQRKIQKAYAQNLLVIKNEKGIQAALDELLRIKNEDLPKMAIADKSRQMNRDWRNAMETEGMLLMSIASAAAALERRESRPTHYRTDYPTNDDANYLVHMWASLNDDGTCSVKKGPVIDTYISADDLIPQIMPIDISIPNPS